MAALVSTARIVMWGLVARSAAVKRPSPSPRMRALRQRLSSVR